MSRPYERKLAVYAPPCFSYEPESTGYARKPMAYAPEQAPYARLPKSREKRASSNRNPPVPNKMKRQFDEHLHLDCPMLAFEG